MTLWSDFLTNDQRLIHKWKHYFPVYERHLLKFVNTDVVFFEIGCGQGGSLQMWKRFLGPNARIVGIDLRPECKGLVEDQIEIRIGDQSDKTFLRELKSLGRPMGLWMTAATSCHTFMPRFLSSIPKCPATVCTS